MGRTGSLAVNGEVDVNDPVEIIARAIVTADEQNGGPPWDYIAALGKHALEPAYDRARAVLAALAEAGMAPPVWRPIDDEAKALGTVLAIMGDRIVIADWDDDRYARKPRPHWRAGISNTLWSRANQPPVYMPLPAAPATPAVDREPTS